MAVVAKGSVPFDLRSTSLSGVALVLRTHDLTLLKQAMTERFGATPDVFSHEPVVIDLSELTDDTADFDFTVLVGLLRSHRLRAAGVRGGNEAQMRNASAAGLGDVPDDGPVPGGTTLRVADPAVALEPAQIEPAVGADVVAGPSPSPNSSAPAVIAPTLIIDKSLRSGQQVYAKGGDLIVLGTVNVGAELIADGSIHVYGALRGKAVAGAKGNAQARIFSTCMEPQLLSIAGTYRTTENPLPADVLGKPAQIRLDGERLVFEPLV